MARRVCCNRNLSLEGSSLQCDLLQPPPPPPVVPSDVVDPTSLLLSNLPMLFSDTELKEYLQKAVANIGISSLTRSGDGKKVLVTFGGTPGKLLHSLDNL